MSDTQKNSPYRKTTSNNWIAALVLITVVCGGLIWATVAWDMHSQPGISLSQLIFHKGALAAMANMPEVIAGLLGIAITVVAIIVELAANRYTPRVTDLFVKSATNLIVLGFFVVSCLLCIWISIINDSDVFVPRLGRAVTVVAITMCLLLLLPYFAFVFNFLNPHNVIERMGSSAFRAVGKAQHAAEADIQRAKQCSVVGIEQLSDVALNAIEHKDKGICMHAVDALGHLMRSYLTLKDSMPSMWFHMDPETAENPDFISMQKNVLDDIETHRFWFEMKVLRQYQMLYGETLNRMRDINYLIAINTRKLAEQAVRNGETETGLLAQKFMNTYLRATINARDVRTAYNVLNQLRLFAEFALKNGSFDLTLEIAKRFKYYGQLGFSSDLPFVLETCAYDLCSINELAFDLNAPCRDELLFIFLDVDKEGEEGHALEASLRGVRKAQVKLATYYLTHNERNSARVIYEDMRNELAVRLLSIHKELLGIESPDFWEVSDRGVNFDYLEPERKAVLDTFFSWFEDRESMLPSTEARKRAPETTA